MDKPAMEKQASLIEALAAAAEVMGQDIRPAGLLAMSDALMSYPLEVSHRALNQVRRECRRLTLADILERIDTSDGRPQADEAWATAIRAMDEAETVVWTHETQQAFAVARPLLEINDRVGARMAFRDAYERRVRDARERNETVQCIASLGWNADRRRDVLEAAVATGRLPVSQVQGLLPGLDREQAAEVVNTLTEAKTSGGADREEPHSRSAALRELIDLLTTAGGKRR